MNAEVHILSRVHYHIYKVHARNLEIRRGVIGHEVFHEFFEAILFSVCLFEVVDSLQDFDVSSFD